MRWDYLAVEHSMDPRELGKLGAEGWELVAVVSPAHFVLHYYSSVRHAAERKPRLSFHSSREHL